MTFAEFARQKRLEAGLSQQQCSDALGDSHRSTFLRKETGGSEWSLKDLQKFASLLGVKASELLREFEEKQ